MTQRLHDMEAEKEKIVSTLSRRQDEYMELSESLNQMKEEVASKTKEIDSLVNKSRSQEAELATLQDTLKATCIHLSELLSVPTESIDASKQSIAAAGVRLFGSDSSGVSALNTLVTRLLQARSSAQGAQDCVSSTRELSVAQSSHIVQLESEAKARSAELEKLRARVKELEASPADDDSLREANETLRRALRGAKENMERSLQQRDAHEAQLAALQRELVALQQNSSEVVAQALAAGEDKAREAEGRAASAAAELEKKESELEKLRVAWESSVGKYEQELAVLRARKVAVEQQVAASEAFLEEQNRVHREEVAKIQEMLQSVQEENKDLKCQVLEREAELESAQTNGEEANEQLQTTVVSLREQLRAMQAKMSSQQSSVTSARKKESELEKKMQEKLSSSIREMEEKDKEIIRQQQKSYEEELGHMREQVSSLTHELEEERKGMRKMRETVAQLNELFESQDRQIELLKSDVGSVGVYDVGGNEGERAAGWKGTDQEALHVVE